LYGTSCFLREGHPNSCEPPLDDDAPSSTYFLSFDELDRSWSQTDPLIPFLPPWLPLLSVILSEVRTKTHPRVLFFLTGRPPLLRNTLCFVRLWTKPASPGVPFSPQRAFSRPPAEIVTVLLVNGSNDFFVIFVDFPPSL